MNEAGLNRLIEQLDVSVEAFAICEIGNGWSLACEPLDLMVVHYVLRGEGRITWNGGSVALRQGDAVIIPAHFAKSIEGAGPVVQTVAAKETCLSPSGLTRFRATAAGHADLVLGCASINARVPGGPDLFAQLREPFAEQCPRDATSDLFNAILREIERPGIGTRGFIGAMMKQIVILFLRAHFTRWGETSPISLAMRHPRLSRAFLLILEHPQRAHSLDQLAAAAGMSRSRFVHHFREAYGRPPIEFLQRVRLQSAARMLRDTKLPIKAISSMVGYASRSQFSHAFRVAYGLDPTAFRREPEPAPCELAEAKPMGAPWMRNQDAWINASATARPRSDAPPPLRSVQAAPAATLAT